MKNATLPLRWPLLITGCAQQTFTVQNKPAAVVAPKETITHHFFVSGIGQKKLTQPKFVAAQKMLLKQKPSTSVNGLLGFITLGIYTQLEFLQYCFTIIA